MPEETPPEAETPSKPPAVYVTWPPTGRCQWVGRAGFDRELSAAGWVLVHPQPERGKESPEAEAPDDSDAEADAEVAELRAELDAAKADAEAARAEADAAKAEAETPPAKAEAETPPAKPGGRAKTTK